MTEMDAASDLDLSVVSVETRGSACVDISALLSTSISRRSLQLGRDLSPEEMRTLEAELEADIARQMLEDECEANNALAAAAADQADSNSSITSINDDDDDEQNHRVPKEQIDSVDEHAVDTRPAVEVTLSDLAAESRLAASPLRINPIPEDESPTDTSASVFQPSHEFVASLTAMDEDQDAASVSESVARRKSFLELAAEVILSPSVRGTNRLSLSTTNAADTSTTSRTLLLSPNSAALRNCMRAAVAHASPRSNVATLGVMFSPEAAPPSSTLTSPTHGGSNARKRVSFGLAEMESPSSPRGGEDAGLARDRELMLLRERVAAQAGQILQAGELGQQLIGELEAAEARIAEQERETTRETARHEEQLATLRTELERAHKKLTTAAEHAQAWRAQVSQAQEDLESQSRETVRAHTKLTMFEASNRALQRELDTERTRANDAATSQQARRDLDERVRHLESRNAALTTAASQAKEELACASLDAAANLKRTLTLERDLRERERDLAAHVAQLAALRTERDAERAAHAAECARLSVALEEATSETERLQFVSRTDSERILGLEARLAQHAADEAAADLIRSPTRSPPAASPSRSPTSTAKKGRNKRLSGLHYSSLLSELETELQHDILLTSPLKIAGIKSVTPPVVAEEDALPTPIATTLETLETSIVPIPVVESVAPAASEDMHNTSVLVDVMLSPVAALRPSSTTAVLATPSFSRARANSAPARTPSTMSRAPAPELLRERSLEGDSPAHPRVEAVLAAPMPTSVLKRPSSAQRLGNWLSAKVAEAENSLRPMFAPLTTSDSEESDTDSEAESEDEKENVRSAQVQPVSHTPARLGTPQNGGRSLPLRKDSFSTPAPAQRVNTTTVTTARVNTVAATPITRTLGEAEASRAQALSVSSSSSGAAADQRVDVLREYFHLATLAVKLSSADENVKASNASVQALYEEAVSRDVPFAHWHRWIEDRLAELADQAAEHEVLRPRQLVLPMATPGRTPANSSLLPMPRTPATLRAQGTPNGHGHVGANASPMIPSRIFETPRREQYVPPQHASIGATPARAPQTPATRNGVTPARGAGVGSTPRTAAHGTPQSAAPRTLGENTRVGNDAAPSTPATAKQIRLAPVGSIQRAMAASTTGAPATHTTSGVHRPAVRGADRFHQRAGLKATSTTNGAGGGGAAPTGAAPTPAPAPAAAAPAPTASLLTRFSSFITATPSRTASIAPTPTRIATPAH